MPAMVDSGENPASGDAGTRWSSWLSETGMALGLKWWVTWVDNGSKWNVAVGVGGEKTQRRAETLAILYLIRNVNVPLVVMVRSQGVVDILKWRLTRWRERGWYATPTMARLIPNADLWVQVDRDLRSGVELEVEVGKEKEQAKRAMEVARWGAKNLREEGEAVRR